MYPGRACPSLAGNPQLLPRLDARWNAHLELFCLAAAVQVDTPFAAEDSLAEGDGDPHQVILPFHRSRMLMCAETAVACSRATEEVAEDVIAAAKAEFPENAPRSTLRKMSSWEKFR